MKGEVPDGEIVDTLGQREHRAPRHATPRIVALALMVPRALDAAERLARSKASIAR